MDMIDAQTGNPVTVFKKNLKNIWTQTYNIL